MVTLKDNTYKRLNLKINLGGQINKLSQRHEVFRGHRKMVYRDFFAKLYKIIAFKQPVTFLPEIWKINDFYWQTDVFELKKSHK